LPDGGLAYIFAWYHVVDDRGTHDAVRKIDEIVDEECRACSQKSPAVTFQHQQVRRGKLGFEIVAAEEEAVAHAETEEGDEEREEDGNGVDGVVGGDEVVVGGDESEQVDCCANWRRGCGHESGREDLNWSSDVIVMLFSISCQLLIILCHSLHSLR